MRVLGVDPGLTRCGFAVVDGGAGAQLKAVAVHVVRTPSGGDIGGRLAEISETIDSWLVTYGPDTVVVEQVFAHHNVRTVIGTAQAAGVVIAAAARRGIEVAVHTPSEVKAAVTGTGRADKAQVSAMVTRLLRLTAKPSPADATDALALAICQIWRGSAMRRLDLARASAAETGARQ